MAEEVQTYNKIKFGHYTAPSGDGLKAAFCFGKNKPVIMFCGSLRFADVANFCVA